MSFYQLPQLSIKNIFINNSLFSCKIKNQKKINLYKTIQTFSNKLLGKYDFSLIEEVFPALFVKPKSNIKKQGWPSVILFSNSSYVLIGGTCYKKIKKINIVIRQLISEISIK